MSYKNSLFILLTLTFFISGLIAGYIIMYFAGLSLTFNHIVQLCTMTIAFVGGIHIGWNACYRDILRKDKENDYV